MSTPTKTKKIFRKSRSASSKPTKTKKPIPKWIGSAAGKVSVKPGVDLTKPTFKVGKYFV
jgi:hypothetical protein